MASTRTTLTLDSDLAERVRQLEVNISAAAREGVAAAVRRHSLKLIAQLTNGTLNDRISSGMQPKRGQTSEQR
jgi:hypothetical protein